MTQPARIFLVDDQPEMEYIIRHLVRRAGHELAARGDVEGAWGHLQTMATAPTLILLDINLPGLSGLELCRRLRTDPIRNAWPVAVFGHWNRVEEIHAALRTGADFVLSKDLIAQPQAWEVRLQEILEDIKSPRQPSSDQNGPPPGRLLRAEEWVALMDRALPRLPLHPLPSDLILNLVRRFLRGSWYPSASEIPGTELISALDKLAPVMRNSSQDSWTIARNLIPQHLRTFTFAFTEQLRYTFGSSAVDAFRHTIAQSLLLTADRIDRDLDPGKPR